MRTTVTLDDDVLKAARRRAREQDRPLKAVINEALRQGLAMGEAHPMTTYTFRLKTVEGRLLSGVDLTDRDKLFTLMERGQRTLALATSILVHAHRHGTAHHEPALALLGALSEGPAPYALFWPSPYKFLRVVTNHRVFDPPSTQGEAREAIRDFLGPPVVRILSETARHPALLDRVVRETRVTGNLIHDAHLVALALEHGVHEIPTLDGDFARFPQVASRNPVQFTDDPALAGAIDRAEVVRLEDVGLRVIRRVDLLHEKLRSASDPARRRSKRLQDLADAQALIESAPGLAADLTDAERALLEQPSR